MRFGWCDQPHATSFVTSLLSPPFPLPRRCVAAPAPGQDARTAAASRQASARLLQCASLLRASDEAAASLELIQLNSLLREFPNSAGSAEAEMVAEGIARQVREPERRRIAELWVDALGAEEPNTEAVSALLFLQRP